MIGWKRDRFKIISHFSSRKAKKWKTKETSNFRRRNMIWRWSGTPKLLNTSKWRSNLAALIANPRQFPVLIECSSVPSVFQSEQPHPVREQSALLHSLWEISVSWTQTVRNIQERDWSVTLIVGTVFRKALGDGKRAVILQPDWAKVNADSLKALPSSSSSSLSSLCQINTG